MDYSDVIIIGGGPVGIFSVFACGTQRLSCLLLDNLPRLGGQCSALYENKNIYDIPGFKQITGKNLISCLQDQAFVFNPEIKLENYVQSIQKDGEFFKVTSNKGVYKGKSIIIALGNGIFGPTRPALKDLELFENRNIFYQVDDLEKFRGENIVIAGAGDSALDWALELSSVAKKIYLVHRREFVKAQPHSWEKVLKLAADGKIEIKIPYTVAEIVHDSADMQGLSLQHFSTRERTFIEARYFLPCFGVTTNIGFLKNWEINLENNKIAVNFATMQTSIPGVYAIGDCVHYLGKRNLILTGFAEAMQCSVDIFKYLHPQQAPDLAHSTDSGLFA